MIDSTYMNESNEVKCLYVEQLIRAVKTHQRELSKLI